MLLYFAEGVPFGFVYTTLTYYLRTQGLPLEQIGILSLLTLAWSLKVLWSPLGPPTVSAPGPPGAPQEEALGISPSALAFMFLVWGTHSPHTALWNFPLKYSPTCGMKLNGLI